MEDTKCIDKESIIKKLDSCFTEIRRKPEKITKWPRFITMEQYKYCSKETWAYWLKQVNQFVEVYVMDFRTNILYSMLEDGTLKLKKQNYFRWYDGN